MIMDFFRRPIEGDHLRTFPFQQAGDGRGNQCAVGVEGIRKGTARDHVEDLDEVRSEHGLPTRNRPSAAPHGPRLIDNPANVVKGKFLFPGWVRCRQAQPAVTAIAVATVGQIDVAFEGQAWYVSLAFDDVRLSTQ